MISDKTKNSTDGRNVRPLLTAALLLASASMLGGCNDAQAGLLLGGGIGALTGQAIGGDTCSTLLGFGIGSSVGYALGIESDRQRQQACRHDWDCCRREVNNYDY